VNFQILNYRGTIEEDLEITSLLTSVFVKEGHTDKSNAEKMFAPAELQKRGEIMLARSPEGKLFGMVIFATWRAGLVGRTEADEAEIHLLAVYPEAQGQGIASILITACEQRATSSGYSKMVLSTQPTMKEAHRVYRQLGYRRNPALDWSKSADNKTYFVYEKLLG
jgi:ribosomal protein S18 acetylase RimI-like enzyme